MCVSSVKRKLKRKAKESVIGMKKVMLLFLIAVCAKYAIILSVINFLACHQNRLKLFVDFSGCRYTAARFTFLLVNENRLKIVGCFVYTVK